MSPRLCRWVFGHDWKLVELVTVEEYPMHHGYALYRCRRCGARGQTR